MIVILDLLYRSGAGNEKRTPRSFMQAADALLASGYLVFFTLGFYFRMPDEITIVIQDMDRCPESRSLVPLSLTPRLHIIQLTTE